MAFSAPAFYKRTWAISGGSVIVSGETVPPRAYDATTGTKGVTFSTQDPFVAALGAAGGIVYALDALGTLYAFDAADGTQNWHKRLLSTGDVPVMGLTIGGGSIYLGTKSGTLYAIDAARGRVLWTYHPGNAIESDLAVADGVAYLKDNAGTHHLGHPGARCEVRCAGVVLRVGRRRVPLHPRGRQRPRLRRQQRQQPVRDTGATGGSFYRKIPPGGIRHG